MADLRAFLSELRRRRVIRTTVVYIALAWAGIEAATTLIPRFAEDIGLVRAWQLHGWPPQVQPEPGTDGSNL
jgi:hypothetical protein